MNKIKMVAISGISSMLLPVVVMAEEGSGSGTANSAVVTAMTSTANDMVATGNSIIPIALTVVGLALVVVFGIRIFKRVAK